MPVWHATILKKIKRRIKVKNKGEKHFGCTTLIFYAE